MSPPPPPMTAGAGPIFESLPADAAGRSHLSSNSILGGGSIPSIGAGGLRSSESTFDSAAALAALSPIGSHIGIHRPPRRQLDIPFHSTASSATATHYPSSSTTGVLAGGASFSDQPDGLPPPGGDLAGASHQRSGEIYGAQRLQPSVRNRMSLFRPEPYGDDYGLRERRGEQPSYGVMWGDEDPFLANRLGSGSRQGNLPPTPQRGMLEKLGDVVNTLRHPLRVLFGGGSDNVDLERASEALPQPARQTSLYTGRHYHRVSSPVIPSGDYYGPAARGLGGAPRVFEQTAAAGRAPERQGPDGDQPQYEDKAEEEAFRYLPPSAEDEGVDGNAPYLSKSPLIFPRQAGSALSSRGEKGSVPVPTVRKSVTFEDDRISVTNIVESPSKRRAVELPRTVADHRRSPREVQVESELPSPSEAPGTAAGRRYSPQQRPSALPVPREVAAGGAAGGRRPSYLSPAVVDEKLLIGSRFREAQVQARRKRQVSSVIKSIEKQYKGTLSLRDFRAFQTRRRGILGNEIKRLINAQKLTLASRYIDYEQAEHAAREDQEDRAAFQPVTAAGGRRPSALGVTEPSLIHPSEEISISASSTETSEESEAEAGSEEAEEAEVVATVSRPRRPAIPPVRRRPATPPRPPEIPGPQQSPTFGLPATEVPEALTRGRPKKGPAAIEVADEEVDGAGGGETSRLGAPVQPAPADQPKPSLFGAEGKAATAALLSGATIEVPAVAPEKKKEPEQARLPPLGGPIGEKEQPAISFFGGAAAPPAASRSIFGTVTAAPAAGVSFPSGAAAAETAVPAPAEAEKPATAVIPEIATAERPAAAEPSRTAVEDTSTLPWWKRNLGKPLMVTTDESGFAENAFEAGEGAAEGKPAPEVPASSAGSLFGGLTAGTTAAAPTTGGDTTLLFGATQGITRPSLFGGAAVTPRPTGSLFGGGDTTATGRQEVPPEKPAGGAALFGGTATTKPTEPGATVGLFDAVTSTTPGISAGLFEGKKGTVGAVPSLFGGTPSLPSGGLFGSGTKPSEPTTSPAAGGGLFGGDGVPTSRTASPAVGGLFGNLTAPKPTADTSKPASPFGGAAPRGSSLFGGGMPSGFSLFAPSATAASQPASSLFAPAAASTPGATAGATGSLFGGPTDVGRRGPSIGEPVTATTPVKPAGPLFGNVPASPSQPTTVFATPPAATTPAGQGDGGAGTMGDDGTGTSAIPSLFGGPTQPSIGGVSLFGAAQPTQATSPFGGGAVAAGGSLFGPAGVSPSASQFTTPFGGGRAQSQPTSGPFGAPAGSAMELFGGGVMGASESQPTQTSDAQEGPNPFTMGSAPGRTRYRIKRRLQQASSNPSQQQSQPQLQIQ